MKPPKILITKRLTLRPFQMKDAKRVQELAGERDIAIMTARIPHPYEVGMAEAWIKTHADLMKSGEEFPFAVTLTADSSLIGAAGLIVTSEHHRAELGYWIGKPYWNNGYATEAGARLVQFGFEDLKINKITSHHHTNNPASGRVLQKLGFEHEGMRKHHYFRFGEFRDIELYGLIKP